VIRVGQDFEPLAKEKMLVSVLRTITTSGYGSYLEEFALVVPHVYGRVVIAGIGYHLSSVDRERSEYKGAVGIHQIRAVLPLHHAFRACRILSWAAFVSDDLLSLYGRVFSYGLRPRERMLPHKNHLP